MGIGAVGTAVGTEGVTVGPMGVEEEPELGEVGFPILRQATGKAVTMIINTKIKFFIKSSIQVVLNL